MDIECYSNKDFQTTYNKRYVETWDIAKKYGIDLSKYYFGQYCCNIYSEGKSEEVTYNHILDENVCFDIQWWNDKLENVELAMD